MVVPCLALLNEKRGLFLTQEAFTFDKMVPGILDLEMIEDTAKRP
jgi:hypothetical protein